MSQLDTGPVCKDLATIRALTEFLEGINPTNDNPAYDAPTPYDIDLRGKVIRGKLVLGDDVGLPALAILEVPKPNTELPVAENIKGATRWDFTLQGFVVDDKKQPADLAYQFRAMVHQRMSRIAAVSPGNGNALFPEDYLLGGRITSMKMGHGVVRPDPQVVSTVGFWFPVSFGIVYDMANPYRVK